MVGSGWPPGLCAVLIGVSLLFFSAGGRAAQISFTASVDRLRTTKAQPIQLTLTIGSTETLSNVPAPRIDLSNFEVYGPANSTHLELGGTTKFTRSLTYSLYPLRTGTFTIGPASLSIGAFQYTTDRITVEVVDKPPRRKPGGDVGKETGQTLEDFLSLRVTTNRERAFVGQQVSLDYDLLYRTQVHDVAFKTVPSFSGFWFKTLFVAKQLNPRREMIGDTPFNVTSLRKVALFPTAAGRHTVEPFEITCSVPQRGRGRQRRSLLDAFSLFDDPFFGRSQSLLLHSDSVAVEVMQLPESGRPDDFAGAVGQYTIATQARPRSVPVGDPVTVVVEVSGMGNIGAVSAPLLSELDGFELYEPQRTLSEEVVNGLYGGLVTYEYIAIPQRGGALEIPALRFAYFDPEKNAYRTASSEPIRVESHGDAPAEEQVAYGLTRAEVEAVGEDIRHIKPEVAAFEDGSYFHESLLYWALHGLAPIGYGVLYLYQRQRRRLVGDVAYARRRRAKHAARGKLAAAQQALDGGDHSGVVAAVQEGILSFVADQSNRSVAGLTSTECVSVVGAWMASDGVVEDLAEVLREAEFLRYAPGAVDAAELRVLCERAMRLLADLEALR